MLRRNARYGELISKLSATTSLILITVFISVLVFLFDLIFGRSYPQFFDYVALNPNNIIHGKYFWTLLTHMFVHGGFWHLFLNMFVLFSLGGFCERIIGKKRFVWMYLISGVFAGLLSVVLAGLFGYGAWANVFGDPTMYMVGASGAIFAIAGLFTVILPKLRFSIIFLPFFSLPAYVMVPAVLVLTWIVSYLGGFAIGNVAHFGGFLIGLLYGFYLRTKYRRKVILLGRHFR